MRLVSSEACYPNLKQFEETNQVWHKQCDFIISWNDNLLRKRADVCIANSYGHNRRNPSPTDEKNFRTCLGWWKISGYDGEKNRWGDKETNWESWIGTLCYWTCLVGAHAGRPKISQMSSAICARTIIKYDDSRNAKNVNHHDTIPVLTCVLKISGTLHASINLLDLCIFSYKLFPIWLINLLTASEP
jgi:hypothetical protein